MKNIRNIQRVLTQIEEHPETWNQGQWHCGTSHCFAGWAQVLSGNEIIDGPAVILDARKFLGLNIIEADYYFSSARTLEELKTCLEPWYDEEGFDQRGFDYEGYNREGFNKRGINRKVITTLVSTYCK